MAIYNPGNKTYDTFSNHVQTVNSLTNNESSSNSSLGAGLGIGLISNLINAGASIFNNYQNNKTQKAINQTNLDYATSMTQAEWERDDTAYQRSVDDAVKAGFSPLAVLDGGLVGNSSPLGYQAQGYMNQAPQLDVNSLVNGLFNNGSQQIQVQENAKDRIHEIYLQNSKHNDDIETLEQEANIQNNQMEKQYSQTLKQIYYQFSLNQTRDEWLYKQEMSKNMYQKIPNAQILEYENWSEYNKQMLQYEDDLSNLLLEIKKNWSASAAGASISSSSSEYNQQLLQQFYETHPYPIYTGSTNNIYIPKRIISPNEKTDSDSKNAPIFVTDEDFNRLNEWLDKKTNGN